MQIQGRLNLHLPPYSDQCVYFQPTAHAEIQSRLNVPFKLRTRGGVQHRHRRWWVRKTHDGRACSELCPTILTPHRGWLTAEGRVCAPLTLLALLRPRGVGEVLVIRQRRCAS